MGDSKQRKRGGENALNQRTADHKQALRARFFGDFRWDYFKTCRHEIAGEIPENCPMCKLVNISVRKYFEDEAEKIRISREISFVKRGRLRYQLLEEWSRRQASFFADIALGFVAEITLSSEVVDAITSVNSFDNETSTVKKVLERQKRMQEIGHFAVAFLQSRVRKICQFKKIRRMILSRFELIPASRTRREFYLDLQTNRHWPKLPRILKYERPGSPNTIQRRLAYEETKGNVRQQKYKDFFRRAQQVDLFKVEKHEIDTSKQFVIFKDVILMSMRIVNRLVREADASAAASLVPVTTGAWPAPNASQTLNPLRTSSTTVPDEGIVLTARPVETANDVNNVAVAVNSGDSGIEAHSSEQLVPVWINLTSPAPPSRQIGLSLALSTPSWESTAAATIEAMSRPTQPGPDPTRIKSENFNSRQQGERGRSAVKSSSALGDKLGDTTATMSTMEPDEASLTTMAMDMVHNGLKELQLRGWQSLCCDSPDEVISKLVKGTDMHPALGSSLHFASDDTGIWNGGLNWKQNQGTEHSAAQYSSAKAIYSQETSQRTSQKTSEKVKEDGGGDEDDAAGTIEEAKLLAEMMQTGMEAAESAVRQSVENYAFEQNSGLLPPVGVLPISLQLRPCPDASRGPAGHFRLFFFQEELVAATHVSSWSMYPEVAQHKDAVLLAIRTYGASPPVRHLVRSIFAKCAPAQSPSSSVPATSRSGSLSMGMPTVPLPSILSVASEKTSVRTNGERIGGCVSLYVPAATEVFGADVGFDVKQDLRPNEVIRLSNTYKFLQRMEAWKPVLKLAQARIMRTKKFIRMAQQDDNDSESDDNDIIHKRFAREQVEEEVDERQDAAINAKMLKQKQSKWKKKLTKRPQPGDSQDLAPVEVVEAGVVNGGVNGDVDSNKVDQMGGNRQMLSATSLSDSLRVGPAAPVEPLLTLPPLQDLSGVEMFCRYSLAGSAAANAVAKVTERSLGDIAKNKTKKSRLKTNAKSTAMLGAEEGPVIEQVMNVYRERLQSIIRSTNTCIADRIQPAPEPPSIDAGPPTPPLRFDLLVVEITLNTKKLRRAAQNSQQLSTPATDGAAGMTGAGTAESLPLLKEDARQAVQKTESRKENRKEEKRGERKSAEATSSNKFTAETHQIVGKSERAPPSLELGLFEWEHFRNIRKQVDEIQLQKQQGTYEEEPLEDMTMQRLTKAKEKLWSRTDESSGISSHKGRTPTGLEFQLRLLTGTPSKEHLEKILPTKVKKWIGMP